MGEAYMNQWKVLFGIALFDGFPKELCCSTNLEINEKFEEILVNISGRNHETDSPDSKNSGVTILRKFMKNK